MKSTVFKVTALGLGICIALSSCATNTQNQNTAIGATTGAIAGGVIGGVASAGSGWVIAGGAIIGGVIGGLIGSSMESSDTTKTYIVMEQSMPNHPTKWTNAQTHTTYVIIPTSPRMMVNGNPNCREYRATSIHHGKKYYSHGVACRQDNNIWMDVSH